MAKGFTQKRKVIAKDRIRVVQIIAIFVDQLLFSLTKKEENSFYTGALFE
jgi:hypothetical protein